MAQRQFINSDTDTWNDKVGAGGDGTLTISSPTTDATANTTITGTAAGTSATAGSGTGFAANKLVIIHQTQGTGAGNWELNKISSVGGGTNWTMVYNLMHTYGTGAQVYLLKEYTTVSLAAALTSQSWGSGKGALLALLANTSITVETTGSIISAGVGFAGGIGSSSNSDNTSANQGESDIGAGAAVNPSGIPSVNNNGAGGGGAFKASGAAQVSGAGGGGNGSVGTTGVSNGSTGDPGTGGSTTGSADLTTFNIGGAGGGGRIWNSGTPGSGGNSGGLVLLISPNIIVKNPISLNGLSGADNNTSFSSHSGTSGGGAGGSLLIKGQTVILGSSLITATGGSHGVDIGSPSSVSLGGDGASGRIHIDYQLSLSGTTTPTFDSSQDITMSVVNTKTFTETITMSETFTKLIKAVKTDAISLLETLVLVFPKKAGKNIADWAKKTLEDTDWKRRR